MPPQIIDIKVISKTSNSIEIEVETSNAVGGKYKYTYKKEGETNWSKEEESTSNRYKISGLETNKIYNVKVVVINKQELETEQTVNVLTGELPTGAITFDESTVEWKDNKASVVVRTSEEGYTLQYQVGGIAEGGWKPVANGGTIPDLSYNQTVYARLWDGTNGTEPASLTIGDKIDPTVTVTQASTPTSNSIAVRVTAADGQSGMVASPKYTYSIKKTSEADTAYVAKESNSSSTSYTFTGLTQGTSYDIKVEVNGDKAGNKGVGYLKNIATPAPPLQAITPDTPAGTQVIAPSTWGNNKVIAISDGSGTEIPLPNGFYYVGGNKTDGLVISDKENDTLEATFPDSGNQFVWIPVKDETEFTRTEFNKTSGQPTTGLSNIYTEPCTSGYSGETTEFNTMKTKVLKYNGFYMGRYEAGDENEGTTVKKNSVGYGQEHTVVVKKGVAPYNYVGWGAEMNDIGNSSPYKGNFSAYLAKNMYNGKSQADSIVSTLCYGSQWDAMCRYIGNASGKTSTKSNVELTGSVPEDMYKNMYDLAGNCDEYTMEAFSDSSRVSRGGNFRSRDGIYYRTNGSTVSSSNQTIGFRVALYIKN